MPETRISRRRYQARLNFNDGMGELWDWIVAVPEGCRTHEILFHLQLGLHFRRSIAQVGSAALAGTVGPSVGADEQKARSNVTVRVLGSAKGPGQLDPVSAERAAEAAGEWDFSDLHGTLGNAAAQ